MGDMMTGQPRCEKRLPSVVAAAALVLCAAAGCEEQRQVKPVRSATAAPVPAQPRNVYRAPELEPLYQALAWTENEKAILSAVQDFNRQWREPGFFAAMQRAKTVPVLHGRVVSMLDCPSYYSLLSDPKHYRVRPVRLTVYVSEIGRLEPGGHFMPSGRWSRDDGPLWRVVGLNALTRFPGDEPFQIYCAFDPAERINLGKPTRVLDGRKLYGFRKDSPRIEVAGLFYKIYREADRGDDERPPQMRSYPIVLAWQMTGSPGAAVEGGQGLQPETVMIFIIIVALLVAYLYLWRYSKRNRAGGLKREKYRPLRNVDEHRAAEEADDDAGDIDPLLKAASEQYRKEKGLDDAPK